MSKLENPSAAVRCGEVQAVAYLGGRGRLLFLWYLRSRIYDSRVIPALFLLLWCQVIVAIIPLNISLDLCAWITEHSSAVT